MCGSVQPTRCQLRAPAEGLRLLRRGRDEADHVALRIFEDRDRDAHRQLGRRHGRLAAELLGLVERALQVVGLHVERDVGLVLRVRSHASADALAVCAGVDDPVLHRVVGVDLPAEQLRVEVLQALAVLPHDLEVDYGMAHSDASLELGSRPASPPAAAVASRGMYWSHPCAWASTASAGRSRCTSRTIVASPSGVKVTSTVLEPGGVMLSWFSQPHVNATRRGGSTSTYSPSAIHSPISSR